MTSSPCASLLLLLPLLLLLSLSGLQPQPFSQVPFLTVWNAPTQSCLSQYHVDLNLDNFDIVHNQNQTFMGDDITIFYSGRLGLYPRYLSQKEPVNGGVPQNSSLDSHLRAAAQDIRADIPDPDFQGLAVVDWESWRPVWERNWDTMEVYQEASETLVRARHPDWSQAQVEAAARVEFEEAAREFMEETLRLGKKERPGGLWGYYGFPDCYNYNVEGAGYSGRCPDEQVKRNDRLLWLWNTTAALYPEIYLSLNDRGLGPQVLLYAHHRVREALRVAAQVTPEPPVFSYNRIVYTYTLDFLSQEHLVYTIGESAALGSAGAVLWGDHSFAKSKAACEAVKFYMDQTLGPYLVNVTSAAALCSHSLCSSHGRCQRREPSSGVYLHLDPAVWRVESQETPDGRTNFVAVGRSRPDQVRFFRSDFQCKCFPGWSGENCSEPR